VKQKDIALIAIVIIISAVFSIIISKVVFGSPKNHPLEASVVQPISADFQQPDSKYFNNQSNDPAQPVQPGSSSNPDPFSSPQQ
jgi:hypothetical protein